MTGLADRAMLTGRLSWRDSRADGLNSMCNSLATAEICPSLS